MTFSQSICTQAKIEETIKKMEEKMDEAKADLRENSKQSKTQQDLVDDQKRVLLEIATPAKAKAAIMPGTDLDGAGALVIAETNGQGAVLVDGIVPAAEHKKAKEELAALKAENAKLKAARGPELDVPEETKVTKPLGAKNGPVFLLVEKFEKATF